MSRTCTVCGNWGCCAPDGDADQMADRITELEAPFILTDQVPTVPGYYWFIECNNAKPEVVRVVTRPGHNYLAILMFTTYGRRDFAAIAAFPSAKWSSAPLPQPQDKNDG